MSDGSRADQPLISLHDCQGICTALPRFLDGESGPVEETQIARHLETCDSCRQKHDELRHEWLLAVNTLSGVSRQDVDQLARVTTEQISANRTDATPKLGDKNHWTTTAAAVLLAAYVLPGLFPGLFPTEETSSADPVVIESYTLVRGDVDANGRLEWSDFHSMIGWLQEDGPQPDCLAAADLDGDGNVTIEDSVLALARLAAGSGLEVSMLYPRGGVDSLPCKELCP
ncbi:MAG: zf-HC2 domain-containing protein [Planctomycetota bacterium]|nr:zf-HC2 domain-containing protein [Planctomycetota bacterium]